jgi:DNA-binding winged helix-turn-helix (wHTH) protein
MSAPRITDPDYAFDRFRLSADGTLLTRDGVAITLAPKVLQILLWLLQHAGEVVRKEQLLQAVWPDSFVEETGLTRNISLLRRALGDDGQHFIATAARVGYRFVPPVERVAAGTPPTAKPQARAPVAGRGEQGQIVVGRTRELAHLHESLDRARGGRGSLISICGEPGIGKTTVVETFLQTVEGSCLVGRGRCSERLSGAEPHLPVLEALDAIAALEPSLVDLLRRTAPTWSRYVARPSSGVEDVPADPGGTGSPERLMRELTTFLEIACRDRAIVIFIEDLHWADVSTIDVLAHLAPRLTGIPLLLIVSYRQRDLLVARHPFARLRGELIARGQLGEVQVSLLGLDDVGEYLRSSFGAAPVPADLASVVFQRTEGNPLFMVEVVRFLRQHTRAGSSSSTAHDVPDSLRGLIDKALESLDPTARQLVSIAAVQGHECDSATLAQVTSLAPSEVEERLRSAAQVHALLQFDREIELSDGLPSLVYRFAHVLYQDALLASIATSKRIEWARQIADAMLQAHAGRTDPIAGSLAVLFETGREYWKASQFFLETSRHAARRFAWASASELAERGLQCLRSARDIGQTNRSRRELDLTSARLLPLASLQGYGSPDVEQLTQRVVALAEELGDVPAAAAALVATWLVRVVRGECVAARDAGTRLASLGEASSNDVLLMNGHMHAQIACHHLGEFRDARRHAAAVMTLADRASHAERCISIFDPVVASLSESARNCWIMGYLARARIDCVAAVALAQQLRHPDSLAFAWLFHAWIHGYRGDWTTCLASTATGIDIARDAGSVQTLAWNQCVHGWALGQTGDAEAGVAELTAAIESSKAIMGEVAIPQFSAMMAEVLLVRGDVDGAESWLKNAIEFERTRDDLYFTSEVHRLSARCLVRRDRLDEACAQLRVAIDLARAQGAATFELRATLNLADINPREGATAVREALEKLPEPEPWPDVDAARALVNLSA